MKNKALLIVLIVLSCILISCDTSEEEPILEPNEIIIDINLPNMFEESDEVTSSSNLIKKENNVEDKYIKINNGGSYLFEGFYDKSVVINSSKNIVHLKLKDVKFELENFAAIYVKDAKKVIITLEGNNEILINNSFVNIDENTVDSAIFSKTELVINGNGNLDIDSTGNGICSKDVLKIMSGNISMYTDNHGIDANDSIRIKNANLNIKSRFDGIHCANIKDLSMGYIYVENGIFDIECGSDGLSASNYLYIASINLKVNNDTDISIADTYSKKGIKSTEDLIIKSGIFNLNTLDDAIHSNKSISIDNGEFTIKSDDDAIHADSSIIINGGIIKILESYEGIEAQNIQINNGNVTLYAKDDGFNCSGGTDEEVNNGHRGPDAFDSDENAFIIINNGMIYVNANGDGIDSNGYIEINGGNIMVEGPTTDGNSSFDYNITATINAGTFIAIGSDGMATNFTKANQGSILYNTSKTYAADSNIKLLDENNNVIFEFTTTKSFSSVIISNQKIENGKTYTLVIGVDEFEITLNSLIFSNGGKGGPGGYGSKPPRIR